MVGDCSAIGISGNDTCCGPLPSMITVKLMDAPGIWRPLIVIPDPNPAHLSRTQVENLRILVPVKGSSITQGIVKLHCESVGQ